jgi:hypothetical protein
VQGKDGRTLGGQPGTAWKVDFVAQPRVGVDPQAALNGVTAVNVRVGTSFVQNLLGITSTTAGVRFSNNFGTGIKSFKLDASTGRGQLETFVLPTAQTGIPRAQVSGSTGLVHFQLGVDLTRTPGENFSGEHGRPVYAKGDTYSEQQPR